MRQVLTVLLFLVGIGGFVLGVSFVANATTVVHEIQGLLGLVIGTLGIGFVAVIAAIEERNRRAGRPPP